MTASPAGLQPLASGWRVALRPPACRESRGLRPSPRPRHAARPRTGYRADAWASHPVRLPPKPLPPTPARLTAPQRCRVALPAPKPACGPAPPATAAESQDRDPQCPRYEPRRHRSRAVEPLHDQVGLALQSRAVGHIAHDGWVGERSQCLSFAEESLGGVVSLPAQDLQRHRLSVQQIAPAEHHAHAPAGHQRLDLEPLGETSLLVRHIGRSLLGLEQVLVPHGVGRDEYHEMGGRGEQGRRSRQRGELDRCCDSPRRLPTR